MRSYGHIIDKEPLILRISNDDAALVALLWPMRPRGSSSQKKNKSRGLEGGRSRLHTSPSAMHAHAQCMQIIEQRTNDPPVVRRGQECCGWGQARTRARVLPLHTAELQLLLRLDNTPGVRRRVCPRTSQERHRAHTATTRSSSRSVVVGPAHDGGTTATGNHRHRPVPNGRDARARVAPRQQFPPRLASPLRLDCGSACPRCGTSPGSESPPLY